MAAHQRWGASPSSAFVAAPAASCGVASGAGDASSKAGLRAALLRPGFIGTTAAVGVLSRSRASRRTRVGRSSARGRSEEHTSELQSLMRNSYAVFCLKKKKKKKTYT